jgi:DNA-binding GntR family transcriptional regulator
MPAGFICGAPSGGAMTAFEAMTKTDLAYRLIRAQILNGELAPETSLDQEVLARSLGLSTTPVREALRRLESERLVRTRAHRDTIVAPASVADLEEVYLVRLQLDPLAASLAAKNASQAVKDKLRELVRTPVRVNATEELDSNRVLHREIYGACGNSVLVEILDRLWDQSDRFRMITISHSHTSKLAAREHEAIVAAVCDGSSRLASTLMRQHVADSLERVRRTAAHQ